ncbi:MAG: IS1595 family transposase [Parafilimonas sp.]
MASKLNMIQIAKLTSFKSFAEMLQMLPDDNSCREYLELIRWNGEQRCPDCGSTENYKLKAKGIFKGLYKCSNCRERYTVTVGTMFEGSHISLRKWFIAIYIFSSHKKGISSHQLARDLGITQKSAWFMLGRIRLAFEGKEVKQMDGVIAADETFIGGKNKNRHADKKVLESQGRSVKDKKPVLGLLKAGGNVHLSVVPDTKATTLKLIIETMVATGSIIVTDEWLGYSDLSNKYPHVVINHKEYEYVRGAFHTNGIENFWSLLKRGIYGIYHQVSPKHLHRYCNEFSYRYNARKLTDKNRFDLSLTNTECRLTYKQLIKNNPEL